MTNLQSRLGEVDYSTSVPFSAEERGQFFVAGCDRRDQDEHP